MKLQTKAEDVDEFMFANDDVCLFQSGECFNAVTGLFMGNLDKNLLEDTKWCVISYNRLFVLRGKQLESYDFMIEGASQQFRTFSIDRPANHAQLILNHMRGINIKDDIAKMDGNDLVDFIGMVVHYRITSIYDLLPDHALYILEKTYNVVCSNLFDVSSDTDNNFIVSKNKKIATRKYDTSYFNLLLGEKSANRFKVKLTSIPDTTDGLMIGFAPRDVINKEDEYIRSNSHLAYISEYARNLKNSLGSVIEVKYEQDKIIFTMDGEDLGRTFTHIPMSLELYPAFYISRQWQLEFID